MPGRAEPERPGSLGRIIQHVEESLIAFLLGAMALVTFVNVVLRYVFNSSLIWGLEVTLILFAWMVLLGVSYGFKVTAHLGVDAVINLLSREGRRRMAITSAAICLAYAFLLLKGAWDYWAPFAALPPTEGRWFPLGFVENFRDWAFYETEQVPMLGAFRWMEDAINQGEAYEKLPRVVPYFILPLACALILFRVIQATIGVLKGERESLIVSHEAEETPEQAAGK